MYNSCYSINC